MVAFLLVHPGDCGAVWAGYDVSFLDRAPVLKQEMCHSMRRSKDATCDNRRRGSSAGLSRNLHTHSGLAVLWRGHRRSTPQGLDHTKGEDTSMERRPVRQARYLVCETSLSWARDVALHHPGR